MLSDSIRDKIKTPVESMELTISSGGVHFVIACIILRKFMMVVNNFLYSERIRCEGNVSIYLILLQTCRTVSFYFFEPQCATN